MRVIKVDESTRNERWILWIVAGTAIGLTAGVLAAEKFSGRTPSARGLLRRARALVNTARTELGPMLAMALELKDAFSNRASLGVGDDEEELDEALADELDDDLDDEVDEELDEELDEALDDDVEEDAEESDEDSLDDEGLDSIDNPLIGRRVLEAFENDPILSERNIEIDADDDAGTVTLFGSVRAPKEVAHAVTLARGVPGVTKVRQRLEVVRRRR